jgi:hypothetical protein
MFVICYDLTMKCAPQAHVLKTWSPSTGTILESGGNLRRWGLLAESWSLEVRLQRAACV